MQQQFQVFKNTRVGSWKKIGFREVEDSRTTWVSGSGKPGLGTVIPTTIDVYAQQH